MRLDQHPKSQGLTPTSYQYNHENLFSRDPEIIEFWDPEIIEFWGLDGSGAPETIPKGGALSAPPFGRVCGAPGALQTPEMDEFWVPGKMFS